MPLSFNPIIQRSNTAPLPSGHKKPLSRMEVVSEQIQKIGNVKLLGNGYKIMKRIIEGVILLEDRTEDNPQIKKLISQRQLKGGLETFLTKERKWPKDDLDCLKGDDFHQQLAFLTMKHLDLDVFRLLPPGTLCAIHDEVMARKKICKGIEEHLIAQRKVTG